MRAYVINIMVVLIIFPVILQTDINAIMLSIGGHGGKGTEVGNRGRSLVGSRSVGRPVINITLILYTLLRYVRKVAREE